MASSNYVSGDREMRPMVGHSVDRAIATPQIVASKKMFFFVSCVCIIEVV